MITYIHEYKEPHEHKEESSHGIERYQNPAVCHIKRQLSKHINDSNIHVTEEQKTAWTAAAEDKTSTEIEEEMTEAIDSKVSEVNTKLDNYQLKSDMNNYAMVDAVDASVAELKAADVEIKTNIEKLATTDALNKAKEELTDADTEIKNTFSNYYTKEEADDKFSGSKDYSIKEFSITGNTITLDLTNGGKFKVTVPSSGSGEKGDKGDKGEDGATGISYSIDIIKNTLTKTTETDNTAYVTGDLLFYVIKTQDTTTYLTDSDATCICYVGGKTIESVAAAYTSGINAWVISLKDYVATDLDPYILIRANTKTGSFITSTVVTFIIPGKDGESKGGQTLSGSVLRRRGDYTTAKAAGKGSESYLFFDGTIKTTADGIMYQDIVTYGNGYYVCIDSIAGENDGWATTPDQASYWEALTMSDDAFYNKLVAEKALIQELSSNEVVILDDDTIVAGMTSSKAIDDKSSLNNKVTNKGDVRIWAGEFTNKDLTTAPFTVTSSGVVTSGTDNKIIIDNGTIYFVVDGVTWHLGITGGKPDWVAGGSGSTAVPYYTVTQSSSAVTFKSGSDTILYLKDGKYYTSSALTLLASGTYYFANALNANTLCNLNSGNLLAITAPNVCVYKKAVFTNGEITSESFVAVGYRITATSIPTLDKNGEATVGSNFVWLSPSEITKNIYYKQAATITTGIEYSEVSNSDITLNDPTAYVFAPSSSTGVGVETEFNEYTSWLAKPSLDEAGITYVLSTVSI